jgi:Spy/CpxP family protein refolding chaperone
MNQRRLLAMATVVLIALSVSAQQTSTTSANQEHQTSADRVEEHMRGLTEKLDLTAAQQAQIKPLVQSFLDDRQKLVDDTSLSDAERMNQIAALHAKGTKQLRTILTDEQKQKLDELERQSNPGAHTN